MRRKKAGTRNEDKNLLLGMIKRKKKKISALENTDLSYRSTLVERGFNDGNTLVEPSVLIRRISAKGCNDREQASSIRGDY